MTDDAVVLDTAWTDPRPGRTKSANDPYATVRVIGQ